MSAPFWPDCTTLKPGTSRSRSAYEWRVGRFKILRGEDVGCDARFFERDRRACGGYNYAFARGRQRQRDLVVLRGRDRNLGRCESGLGDGGVARLGEFEFAACIGGFGYGSAGDLRAFDRAAAGVGHYSSDFETLGLEKEIENQRRHHETFPLETCC